MPIYTYECKICNRQTDSLEDIDTINIGLECDCLDGMLTTHTRVDYPTDTNLSGRVVGGTPRFKRNL